MDGGLRKRSHHGAWAHHACQSPLRSVGCSSHRGGPGRASSPPGARESKASRSPVPRKRRSGTAPGIPSVFHPAPAAERTRAIPAGPTYRASRSTSCTLPHSTDGRAAPWLPDRRRQSPAPVRAQSSAAAKSGWEGGTSRLFHLCLQVTDRQLIDCANQLTGARIGSRQCAPSRVH